MILAIDIGNSNVTLGLYADGNWKHFHRLPTKTGQQSAMFYQMGCTSWLMEQGIEAAAIEQVAVSTVVPALRRTFEQLSLHLFGREALMVSPEMYQNLRLKLDRAEELGTDLFANAVAAHYLHQQDCIIVDFGTALTFTVVDKSGQLLGVSIAPGLKTAIRSLFQKTAQLPEVPLEMPASAIGKDTVHAIQSGILVGYVGLVRHMLSSIRAEVGPQYMAVATGGLSAILHPLQADFDAIDPHLTLDGLRIIAEETVKTIIP
ncbi:MAG: type III pantothenate kinase [Phaeodactylibacter sp.]|uniref:type III pantothenate kinase n=1 Tax=Phaeodactylibacter sp. TaxID=1940289 RepID=UPI0032EE07B7